MSALDALMERAFTEGLDIKTELGHDGKGENVLFVICLQGPCRSVGRERAIDRFQISQWNLPTRQAIRHGFDCVAEDMLKVFDAEPWRSRLKRPLSFICDESTKRVQRG